MSGRGRAWSDLLVVVAAGASVVASGGCNATTRETTTARTPQEMLRMSAAAERAVRRFDPRPLRGRAAFVQVAGLEDVPERAYVLSAMRDHLMWHDVPVVRGPEDADVIVEVRGAALGPYEAEFRIGLPPLPFPVLPESWTNIIGPDLTFGYELRDGFAALDVFVLDVRSGRRLLSSQRLWGRGHDGLREDIWPDDD